MDAITICQTAISQDEDGRFCLNDLHRAAMLNGANKRTKEPGKFLGSRQTADLVKELADTQDLGIDPVNTVKGGAQQGTYVVKELVYAYAMWVSPSFHLKVIRAYDAMVTAELQRLNGLHHRAVRAELEYLEGVANASRCGLGLRAWRDSKPLMQARLDALQQEMQPALPLFH